MPTNKPLLRLPRPSISPYSPPGGGSRDSSYNPSVQIPRIDERITRLERIFTEENVEFSLTISGIAKEKTLVIVVKKSVANFYAAVQRTEGLEWIGESDWEQESGKYCYLLLQNQNGLEQLLNDWNTWKNYYESHPDEDDGCTFGSGRSALKKVFREIEDIRYWDERDRLRESGGYQYLKERIDSDESDLFLQVEFFYQPEQSKRNKVVQLFQESGGQIVDGSECVIEEIAYHGLIAKLDVTTAHDIVSYYENPESEVSRHISFISCDGVMLFSAVGQARIDTRDIDVSNLLESANRPPLPDMSLPPVIAVLDGLPVENHLLLQDRLSIDDPDEWGASYPVAERQHGTEMVSLVTLGNLKNGADPLTRKVYVRPILRYDENPYHGEYLPEYPRLGIDLFHRAIIRLFEGDAVCPTVKIINLSVGDNGRIFSHFMSPWARLLDWFSVKYNVLFVVSGGNHYELSLEMDLDYFSSLPDGQGWKEFVNHVYQEKAIRSLLSPAESINALTVGSIHPNIPSNQTNEFRKNPLPFNLPCLYSPFGFGYMGSVKPDLLYYGGGTMVRGEVLGTLGKVNIDGMSSDSCNVRVAVPSPSGTQLNRMDFSSGTSNAAALVTHELGKCYDVLEELLAQDPNHDKYMAVLLKAMAVHGASWGNIAEMLPLPPGVGNRDRRKEVTRWVGFGVADLEKVRECTNSRVTLFSCNLLSTGKKHTYRIQVPPYLHLMTQISMTVTLAWMSPISLNRTYRKTKLSVEVPGFATTSPHSVPILLSRKGTVMHQVYKFEHNTIHQDYFEIVVGSSKHNEDVTYGLFVTIAAKEGIDTFLLTQSPVPTLYDAVREVIGVEVLTEQEVRIGS